MKSERKNPWRFLCLGAAVLAGLWMAVDKLLPLLVARKLTQEAASIGIIGGADGPTAIFITSQPSSLWNWLVPLVILILGIVGFIRLGHCKNSKKEEGEA